MEPDEIGINTCLILQNTLDVTVTALAIQNKTEPPNQVKGFVETVVPNYCDICLVFQDEQTNISGKGLFTSYLRDCVMIYMTSFLLNIRFIIADHCCCAMIL